MNDLPPWKRNFNDVTQFVSDLLEQALYILLF